MQNNQPVTLYNRPVRVDRADTDILDMEQRFLQLLADQQRQINALKSRISLIEGKGDWA